MKILSATRRLPTAINALFLLCCCLAATFCLPEQGFARESDKTNHLLQAVGDYGKGHHRAAAVAATPSLYSHATDEVYGSQIIESLRRREFSKLEDEAHRARAEKDRFPGGVWSLFLFYGAVSKPTDDTQAQDADWIGHLAVLKEWATARPDSATARVAIAETYLNFAVVARGGGWANTVSDSGWKLFEERTAAGAAVLVDAVRVKERCPYWYEAVQQVALFQSWSKADAREILDQAISFEPDYYHFYREYASFLLPKWEGKEGDTEAFAEEVSKGNGAQETFLYFEISSLLICQCRSERPPMPNVSWPRIKQGYAALGQLYGFSNLKSNRMALMAFVAGDKQAAQEAFIRVGDHWDTNVWTSYDSFERAKQWATSH